MILLCGKSGVGKSTLVKLLSMKEVVSHTTRQMRNGERNGIDKWFHKSKPKIKNPTAYTNFNGYEYWTTAEDFKDKDVFIIDVFGIRFMQNLYKDKFEKNFSVVYVTCNPIKRLYRIIRRDGVKKGINRFIHDFNAFKPIATIKHHRITL